jgi:hypothetical protein
MAELIDQYGTHVFNESTKKTKIFHGETSMMLGADLMSAQVNDEV